LDEPPIATTSAAASISATSATLNGLVGANTLTTSVSFEYGLTNSYGTVVAATPGSVTGSSETAVSAALTGLTSNITYHFRVIAVNSAGTTYGDDQTFTTTISTGLAENKNDQIMLYPNPTTDDFRIKGLNGISFVTLVDVSGRALLQKQVSDNELVSVSALPNGVYILKIRSNEGMTECKVVKK